MTDVKGRNVKSEKDAEMEVEKGVLWGSVDECAAECVSVMTAMCTR